MRRFLLGLFFLFNFSLMHASNPNENAISKTDTINYENKCLVFFHPTEQQFNDSLSKHSYYAEIESDFTYSVFAVKDSLSKSNIKCVVTDNEEIILVNLNGQKYEFKRNDFKSSYGAIYIDGVNEPRIITKIFPAAFYYELIGKVEH